MSMMLLPLGNLPVDQERADGKIAMIVLAGPDMHADRIEPREERLLLLNGAPCEITVLSASFIISAKAQIHCDKARQCRTEACGNAGSSPSASNRLNLLSLGQYG
jgi:hypothetical protein